LRVKAAFLDRVVPVVAGGEVAVKAGEDAIEVDFLVRRRGEPADGAAAEVVDQRTVGSRPCAAGVL
jgi:hypothetical protein